MRVTAIDEDSDKVLHVVEDLVSDCKDRKAVGFTPERKHRGQPSSPGKDGGQTECSPKNGTPMLRVCHGCGEMGETVARCPQQKADAAQDSRWGGGLQLLPRQWRGVQLVGSVCDLRSVNPAKANGGVG